MEVLVVIAVLYLWWEPANSLCLVEHEQLGFGRLERFEHVQEEISQVDVVILSLVHKLHL